jgi:hypothetical protein
MTTTLRNHPMNTPRDVLDHWMQAVNHSDVEALLGLYDAQAVLIPTFSNRLLNTPEKLRDYFEQLGSREALSIALHDKTLLVQSMPGRLFALGGLYNWRFMVEGELLNFEARFSYLVDLARQRPILHHHSSQIPRML